MQKLRPFDYVSSRTYRVPKNFYKLFLYSILILLLFMLGCHRTFTPQFLDSSGTKISNSIAIMEEIQLNNSKQWIYVRGEDQSKPMLLFLHGGPGTAATGLIKKFLPELEEKFCVVHWDQRGAGKSFSAGKPKENFTVEQMIEDVGELSKIILKKYNREKLYLMGVSWGSYLGIEAIKKWPQYYTAYIGSGQIVYQNLGEQLSYDYVMQKSIKKNDLQAVKVLKKIGRPPYPIKKHVKYLMKQRNLLSQYEGSFKNKKMQKEFSSISTLWQQSEYNFLDKINWVRGQIRSEKILGPVFRKVDFRITAKSFELPIYIAQGKYDMQTPTSLVIDWFHNIEASHKELQIFANSAHLPLVEEKEAFLQFMDKILYETGF